ncbi:MAG TPA: tRNA lysidine(34) synthetase TilS [Gammaproteobacteria bacterium]|nr:tRNA lysidine(34) synthetase TilS [Gammaproteobacteria bacterium]
MVAKPFTPQRLLGALEQFPPARRYLVAYSGGLDSHVLLHSLALLRDRLAVQELHAVHVDHRLSPSAGEWSRHCTAICNGLDVPCHVLRVDARHAKGESPEAAARKARYEAIAAFLQESDGLLTAHHLDDQAETVLLQLLRGCGPRGLAAMPPWDRFGAGWHGRPLLGFSREDLRGYARSEKLRWIEDESNYDTGFERNFLRHEVIPLLRSHWPALGRTLSRTAMHSAEAAGLLDRLAAEDLAVEPDGGVSIVHLKRLDPGRQRNVLRYWIRRSGLPLPDTAHLQRIIEEVLPAAADGAPRVAWPGAEIRRYRDRLYALTPLPEHDNSRILEWDLAEPMPLPGGAVVRARQVAGRGVKRQLCSEARVTVRFRQGGERCRPAGRGHTRSLKKLLQEHGVPPWHRERLPLIHLDGKLAAVAGLFVCEPFQARDEEPGLEFSWEPPAPAFSKYDLRR